MKRSVVLLVVLFLALTSGVVQAQEKIQAVTEEFAPFNYTENGKVTGYSTRVVEEMLRRAGLPYELHSYPWSRSYKIAQSLPNVVVFTLARTPEREKQFHWIGALAKRKLYFYKLASRKDIHVEKIDDVKRYRISVNRDDAAETLLIDMGFSYDKNLDLAPSDAAGLNKLLAGRVDFITGTDYTVDYLLQQAGADHNRLQRSIVLIDQGEYYVAASKGTSPEIVRRLREAYEQMEKEGVIKSLQPKFE